jgi:hypothetical protein
MPILFSQYSNISYIYIYFCKNKKSEFVEKLDCGVGVLTSRIQTNVIRSCKNINEPLGSIRVGIFD